VPKQHTVSDVIPEFASLRFSLKLEALQELQSVVVVSWGFAFFDELIDECPSLIGLVDGGDFVL